MQTSVIAKYSNVIKTCVSSWEWQPEYSLQTHMPVFMQSKYNRMSRGCQIWVKLHMPRNLHTQYVAIFLTQSWPWNKVKIIKPVINCKVIVMHNLKDHSHSITHKNSEATEVLPELGFCAACCLALTPAHSPLQSSWKISTRGLVKKVSEDKLC